MHIFTTDAIIFITTSYLIFIFSIIMTLESMEIIIYNHKITSFNNPIKHISNIITKHKKPIYITSPATILAIIYGAYTPPLNYTASVILYSISIGIAVVTLLHYILAYVNPEIQSGYEEYIQNISHHKRIEHYHKYNIPLQYNPKEFIAKRDYYIIKRAIFLIKNAPELL